MKKLVSLKSSKFEILSNDNLAALIGGAVDNRTRTVTVSQTAAQCEDCRPDYSKEVVVRHDD
jgi:hypothetical protein